VGRGMIDLTGHGFGRLRVMDFTDMGGTSRIWLSTKKDTVAGSKTDNNGAWQRGRGRPKFENDHLQTPRVWVTN
jgi:hypothetical protein